LYLAALIIQGSMLRKLLLLSVIAFLVSCKKDNPLSGVVSVPPAKLDSIRAVNDEALINFLKGHTYREGSISEVAEGDISLWDDSRLGTTSINIRPSEFNLDEAEYTMDEIENGVPHNLYYFVVNPGVGIQPSVADSVYVQYTGRNLDLSIFDEVKQGGSWFDLATIQAPFQGFRGFAEGVPFFKASEGVEENLDGTFTAINPGHGFIFFPSAMASYNTITADIPQYGPIFFEITLIEALATDHDGDGILSILEDRNGNGYLYDDNTDEDYENENRLPVANDFLDADDDGDGTPTKCEISLGLDPHDSSSYYDADNDGDGDDCDD